MSEKAKTFIDAEIKDGHLDKFVQYCAKFGKSYVNQAEFKLRLRNWKQAEKFIEQFSSSQFKVGHNKFSDWSDKEYEKILGFAAPAEKMTKNFAPRPSNTLEIASSIDWTANGMVSEVAD